MPLLRKGRWAVLLTALFVFSVRGEVEERLKVCAGCHGADGSSVTPGIPSIAAQPTVFLENSMILMREGLRGSAPMQQLLKGVGDREIVALAAHYAKLPPPMAQGRGDDALYERGRQLAVKLRCASCHLPDFSGRAQMPRLAAQREEYLDHIMRTFRDAPPPGSDTLMNAALYGVSDADIRAMAHFLARYR